jgi:hypothetical protein
MNIEEALEFVDSNRNPCGGSTFIVMQALKALADEVRRLRGSVVPTIPCPKCEGQGRFCSLCDGKGRVLAKMAPAVTTPGNPPA